MENALDRGCMMRAYLFARGVLALPPLCNAGGPDDRFDALSFAHGVAGPHRISVRERMARPRAMPLLRRTPCSDTRKMRTLRRRFRSAAEGRHRDIRIRSRLSSRNGAAARIRRLQIEPFRSRHGARFCY